MKNNKSIKEILIQILNRLDQIHLVSREWFTTNQVAEYIGVSKDTVYKYVHKRKIPYYKIANNRILIFKREEIDSWIMGEKKEADIDPNEIADRILETLNRME